MEGPARARARFARLCSPACSPSCGDDEEARLEELSQELGSLREGLPETARRVAERETTAKAAQDELAEARGALRESERRIAEIEKEVGAHATDPLLFRMIQKQLLEDDDLEDVAISARVEHGVVTLSGVVPEAEAARARREARRVRPRRGLRAGPDPGRRGQARDSLTAR